MRPAGPASAPSPSASNIAQREVQAGAQPEEDQQERGRSRTGPRPRPRPCGPGRRGTSGATASTGADVAEDDRRSARRRTGRRRATVARTIAMNDPSSPIGSDADPRRASMNALGDASAGCRRGARRRSSARTPCANARAPGATVSGRPTSRPPRIATARIRLSTAATSSPMSIGHEQEAVPADSRATSTRSCACGDGEVDRADLDGPRREGERARPVPSAMAPM